MDTDSENILNTLRAFLEEKDKLIEDLKNSLRRYEEMTNNLANGDTAFNSDSKCHCNCHKTLKFENCTQTFATDFEESEFANELHSVPENAIEVIDSVVEKIVDENCAPALTNDYIFDEASKMYYSPSTGYYYDQERNLLYDPYSRIYYKYDSANNCYEFYYQLDSQINEEATTDLTEQVSQKVSGLKLDDVSPTYNYDPSNKIYKDTKKKKNYKKRRDKFSKRRGPLDRKKTINLGDNVDHESISSLEEGEIPTSSSDELESSFDDSSIQSPFIPVVNEDSLDALPPCIRAIVKKSSSQKVGSLFLIPYTGGTIGSDSSNSICVPDISISRTHADISFDKENWIYKIIDLGSTNGTFINGNKLIQSVDHPSHPLQHGDVLSLGSCKMLIHVHAGNATCKECEPGLVQAELPLNQDKSSPLNSKEDKQKKRKKNLKLLKKKFGLENTAYIDGELATIPKSNYQDRAKARRQTVGSQNPYEKDTPPATLDTAVPASNLGYKMLKKMGWSEGESIGAINDAGIMEPIGIHYRNTRAGLGSDLFHQISLPEDPRLWKWKKAQKRAHELYEGIDDDSVDY